MKKTPFFLLVCSFYFSSLSAQHPGDYQFQFQFENTLNEWVQASDGSWYGAGWSVSYPGYPMGIPFVLKWDAQNDSLLWRRDISMPLAETVWDVALLPAADGGVYIGAAFDGCDYTTRDGLAKLSANGDVLWTKQTPTNTGWSSKIWLFPYPDGHLLYQTDHYQIEFDANGTVKWTDILPFQWNGVAKRQDGGYLVYGDQKVGTTNLFLGIIEYPFLEEIFHALQLPSGNWLFLGDQHIYRVASDFSVLVQKPVSGIKPWSNLFETDGQYWVSAENAAGASELRRIDTATLEVLSIHVAGSNYRIKSLIHVPGDSLIWLSGDCNFDRNQTVFLKSTPKNDPVITPDRSLALTNIHLGALPKAYPYDCSWDPNLNFAIDFGAVYVTVKNTGNTPVQKFRVNGNFSRCSFICQGFEQVSEEINLALQPGDSTEFLLLSAFDLNGQENNAEFNLCFWTALPDDRLDANPEDDRFCSIFSVLVSDQEPDLNPNGIRVSPNPAANNVAFFIESPSPASDQYTISLTDLSGRVVLKEYFSGPSCHLSRGVLPAGIYFYKIETHHTMIGAGKILFVE